MTPAFWFLWIAGITLQILVVHCLTSRRLYRRFPILFAYAAALLITSLLDMAMYLDWGGWGRSTINVYWTDDVIRQIGLLTVLLSLVYENDRRAASRGAVVRWLGFGFAAAAATGYVIYLRQPLNEAWTQLIRNLSFIAVIYNFLLWTRLIAEKRDRLLLALSAGVGVQVAGEAIGHSLRTIGLAHRQAFAVNGANYLLVIAHICCLFIWFRALSAAPRVNRPLTPSLPKSKLDLVIR